ncbi:hypothetical protein SH449x_003442 [Pirellulaceae bacterium SH449]
MTAIKSPRRAIAIVSVIALNLLLACVLARAAWVASPTFDETAHFASGIVLAQYADPGYFRVNPPANKWLIAFVEPIIPVLELPPVVPSTQQSNASRMEFQFGQQVMSDNETNYRRGLLLRWPIHASVACMTAESSLLNVPQD